jgi:uncharacterized membrane protein YtjA (UPF0391 family)
LFGIAIAVKSLSKAVWLCDTNGASFQIQQGESTMLRAAILFLVIALVAGLLGAFQTEGIALQIAWILFVVFLILAVVSFVMGRGGPRSID